MSSNFSRVRAENQFLFLGTGQILGVNSIDITNNFGNVPVKYIGIGNKPINQSTNSAQYADLNISTNFVQEDFLIQQTGGQPFNCFIFQDPTNPYTCYSLISGYINSYSAKYVNNQVPQINSTLRFYNNAGNIPLYSLDAYSSGQIGTISSNTYPTFDGDVADTNYSTLSINEGITNRIQDFSFSIDFNRLPIYNIGSRSLVRIETIFPINVSCNLTFEAANNFVDVDLTDFPLNKILQNIELNIYSNRTNNNLGYYLFNNMTLVSNNRSLNTEGNLILNRKYVGQLFSFVNQSGLVFGNWDFGMVIATPDFYVDWGQISTSPTGGFDFGVV